MNLLKKSLGSSRGAPRSRAKWGQNFLRDPKILKKIADFARIEKNDTVVEIGPGEGTLTKLLLDRAKKVVAIERDEELAKLLTDKFKSEILTGKLKIINDDVLNYELGIKDYALVGNIPYYITGALFKKFLESENQPQSITFVVQKEVAERIIAKNEKESILSISIKVYGEPEFGGIIKAGSFFPKPKVDSAIIAIRDINKKRFEEITPPNPLPARTLSGWLQQEGGPKKNKEIEKKFFEILKAGFAHKRKLLIKNLEKVAKGTFDTFKKCDIPEKARAEDLKVEDWVCLIKNLLSGGKF